MTITVDRQKGLSGGLAIKAPVKVATTGNISLSGLQTIDGISLSADDRVLVWMQTNPIDNGIWDASSGSWSRALDFNGSGDVVQGTAVKAVSGSTYGGATFELTTEDPVIGTSSLSFATTILADLSPVSGAGLVGFSYALTYAANTVGSWLKGLASYAETLSNKALASTCSGVTQSASDSTTKIATTAFVHSITDPIEADLSGFVQENILPNSQWQLASTGYVTKQNEAGTGDQTAITCTGFDVSNNNPRFFTSNTQELKVGDIVVVSGGGFQWGYAGAGYVSTATAVRVESIVPGVSVRIAPVSFGGVTPAASAACTLTPITGGVSGAGSGQSLDGWKKSTTAITWADDFSSNSCVGAIRTLGVRKGAASGESVSFTAPTAQIRRYAGRSITFGCLVRQKVQSGAGTWTLSISDGVGTTTSSNGTGTSYSDPTYGGFEFKTVTRTVSASATTLVISVNLTGASSDVYYIALPTAGIGSAMYVGQCKQMVNELIRPVGHWNPPLLTPYVIDMPATAYPGTGGLLFGYSGIDMEAISLGAVHKSVCAVKCKLELVAGAPWVNHHFFTGSKLDYSLIFGPQQVVQVAGNTVVGQGWLPFSDDGTVCMFSDVASFSPTNVTFDFDLVQLNQAMAMN